MENMRKIGENTMEKETIEINQLTKEEKEQKRKKENNIKLYRSISYFFVGFIILLCNNLFIFNNRKRN